MSLHSESIGEDVTEHTSDDLFEATSTIDLHDNSPPTNGKADFNASSFTEVKTNTGCITVKILNPEKIGDGISAYIMYRLQTTTSLADFSCGNYCVPRRFSDFLGLHEKLKMNYLCRGVIIPPPPSKNLLGSTKLKISKGTSAESDFVERRRLALERFLDRLVHHPVLHKDAYLRDFLTSEGELPKSSHTQVLSGAMAKKLLRNVGDAMGKLTFKMDETDEFFEFKTQELETWEVQIGRLHSELSALVTNEQDLASSTLLLGRALSLLSNVEEHTGLARSLSQLAETEEQISQFQGVQAEIESTYLSDYAKELLALLMSCKETLAERARIFKATKDLETSLRSKREQKVRIEMSPKADRRKIPTLESEIHMLEGRVTQSQDEFEVISAAIKKEFEYFDTFRFDEFKNSAVEFLNLSLQVQEKILQTWESYIGQANSIE